MRTVASALVLFGSVLTLPANAAVPLSPLAVARPPNVIHVAMGCGIGRTRHAMGHCRHRFNLFRQHRSFRAYEDRHCTPMMTPNGCVNRCKI